jgi:hypothetical protein
MVGPTEEPSTVQVDLEADHWDLTSHFDMPYAKWGVTRSKHFILKVEKTVAIDLEASGSNPWVGQ